MEEKFKRIESKKELFAEIAVATGKAYGTIKSHWFNPCKIPDKHLKIVIDLIDRRLEYQDKADKLHTKYFGK